MRAQRVCSREQRIALYKRSPIKPIQRKIPEKAASLSKLMNSLTGCRWVSFIRMESPGFPFLPLLLFFKLVSLLSLSCSFFANDLFSRFFFQKIQRYFRLKVRFFPCMAHAEQLADDGWYYVQLAVALWHWCLPLWIDIFYSVHPFVLLLFQKVDTFFCVCVLYE